METIRIHKFNNAKIFQPFDALEGLRAALALKEQELDKPELPLRLDDEETARLDRIVSLLKKGQKIRITFLWDGCRREICDTFQRVDTAYRAIVMRTHIVPCDAVIDIRMT